MTTASMKIDARQFFPQLTAEQVEAMAKGAAVEVSGVLPRVTCVLPFGEVRRHGLARQSVRMFSAQTYPNKELIIVNTTDKPIFANNDLADYKEIMLPGETLSLGAMRNRGIDAATGSWIKHWDDDDVYSPHLLAYMMLHRRPERDALLLRHQIRVHRHKGTAYRQDDPGGIPNTILFPKTDARYGDIDAGDDAAFVIANWSEGYVINNNSYPTTLMVVAVYHGANITTEKQFMGQYAGDQHAGHWYLAPEEIKELPHILATVNLQTVTKPTQAEPAADSAPVA